MNKFLVPVFDFGGVLLEWNPRSLYRRLLGDDDAAVEEFLARIEFYEWNKELDRGQPFRETVEAWGRRFPADAELIRAFDECWEESLVGAIEPVVEIVRRLKEAGYPLYGLSNWSYEKFLLVRARYEFFSWFDEIIISGAVHLLKPDPLIYQFLLERTGRRAGECLFIDDAPRNVAAAEELGFQAILFRSAEELEEGLRGRGLRF